MSKEPKTTQQKIGIGLAVLLGLVVLNGLFGGNKEEQNNTAAPLVPPAPVVEQTPEEKASAYIARLEAELAGFEKFDVREYTQSVETITLALALFGAWAELASQASEHTLTDAQRATVASLKTAIRRTQRDAFPRLRDAYGPAARTVLWENDITAKTFGQRFTTIQFVGTLFAANRNKLEFQQGINDMMHQLRFSQVRYKWYERDDEYTYWTLESPDDAALVIWTSGGRFRVVE